MEKLRIYSSVNSFKAVFKIIAEDIIDLKSVRSKFSKHVHVKIEYNQENPDILNAIRSLAESNPGNCRFIINIESSSGYSQKIVSQDLNVSSNIDFITQMRNIAGDNNVWIGI